MNYSDIKDKIILTGIQATSSFFHIGNYLSAIAPLKELSKNNKVYFFIADYHSLNTVQNKEELRNNKKNILCQVEAIFKNYPNICIFEQSKINAIPHIALLLGSTTSIGLMNRAHKVKESRDNGKSISLGTFYYPNLMASDILTFDSDYVPVGIDQKQHLEFCSDMSSSFNKIYGKGLLKSPEPLINEDLPLVMGIDGVSKMSKSKNNYIAVFDDIKKIEKSIMKIKTDNIPYSESKNPDNCNVYKNIKLFATKEENEYIRSKYLGGCFGYGDAKYYLLNLIKKYFEKETVIYNELMNNSEKYDELMLKIEANNNLMNEIANKKLLVLKKAVGLI